MQARRQDKGDRLAPPSKSELPASEGCGWTENGCKLKRKAEAEGEGQLFMWGGQTRDSTHGMLVCQHSHDRH